MSANDPLSSFLKREFPKYSDNTGDFLSILEYVGPREALLVPVIGIGVVWGTYPGTVSYFNFEPSENPRYGTLKITCSYKYQASEMENVGTVNTAVRAEVEWTDIARPLAEHPEFQSLTVADFVDVDLWRNEPSAELKSEYKYRPPKPDGQETEPEPVTLSPKAKNLALGYAMGIESFPDTAPVYRKITTYLNGYPPTSSVGVKGSPSVVAGSPGPSGYEWVKTADRAIQVGEKNRWDRIEEWTGAKKVLVDSEKIYYAPAA